MIEIDTNSFATIARIARREAGLHLSDSKAGMVHARLQRRLRSLGLQDYRSYCDLLETGSSQGEVERRNLIEALTTNVTHFFREEHHFPLLVDHFKAYKATRPRRPFRVWSAGCSNGSEPVSICLALAASPLAPRPEDVSVLATDIDGGALAHAEAGRYPAAALTDEDNRRYATHLERLEAGDFMLTARWRRQIRFIRSSLLDAPPSPDLFDVIFCRNVTIYFDAATASRVHRGLLSALRDGGLLCLGHSERLIQPELGVFCRRVGPTAYVKQAQRV